MDCLFWCYLSAAVGAACGVFVMALLQVGHS
jgi:hypothetical protein